MPRLSIPEIAQRKNTTPLVVLTAYTASMAALLDPHVDMLLVGDSLGMVVYGMENTLGVTLEQMIWHGRAVAQASKKALVVVDMPYGSYEASPPQALVAAQRLLHESGAQAVKLEGGAVMAECIAYLVKNDIPVMAHIGLMPQHVAEMGGYKIQGKNEASAAKLLVDAKAVEAAGAFSVVIEGVIENVARLITASIAIPTIGIGASSTCDGQVLVIDDMLGLTPNVAKFVRQYAQLEDVVTQAAQQFAEDVRTRQFPSSKETY